ncbi:hypothetical protein BWQ96_00678 [Gracilariopsis chorda]|uniref:Uncharacterized protein n=1 Tax=Gracilariopsis chorda TaxID=448386 RepID=A0A2V3J5A0_9FLOR|nr:hypothetical protein BWQ96_00678 [Gracilariopsis chorda]|eukprot:PXF49608.1 hypothetical protein BWQ96_00678 [Gracilariopsis chorda]
MVLIPLKSQYVSLINTIISLLTELSLLKALLRVNNYCECHALQKGHHVSVTRHQNRATCLVLVTTAAFFAIELLLSFYSDPAVKLTFQSQPCVAVETLTRRSGDPGTSLEEIGIVLSCVKTNESNIFLRVGNYSMETRKVECAESATLMFTLEPHVSLPIGTAAAVSSENPFPDPLLKCADGFCVVIQTASYQSSSSDTTVWFSDVFFADEVSMLQIDNSPIKFLNTTIFSAQNNTELLPKFAERLLQAYDENLNDPFELRRLMFLGSERDTCQFQRTSEATEVPPFIIVSVSTVWVISLAAYAMTLLLSRRVFYDISNPVHWAKRTYRRTDEPVHGDPSVSRVLENGHHVMYVSGSNPEGNGSIDDLKISF